MLRVLGGIVLVSFAAATAYASVVFWNGMMMTPGIALAPDMTVRGGAALSPVLCACIVAVPEAIVAFVATIVLVSLLRRVDRQLALTVVAGPLAVWTLAVLVSVGPLLGGSPVESGPGIWLVAFTPAEFVAQSLIILLPATCAALVVMANERDLPARVTTTQKP